MTIDEVRSFFLGSWIRIGLTVVIALVGLVAVGYVLGILGVPTVESVQNEFGAVNDSTTVIESDLTVRNPNPIGVKLGGTTVNYTVLMNNVTMATGQKSGLAVERGTSTLAFRTQMKNDNIPDWWTTHIRNEEETSVLIDARVRSSLLGGRTFALPQEKTIETDIIGSFNSEETRPVEANRPVFEDPILYVNETSASWDRAGLTAERTPIDMSFTLHNPKTYPFAITEIGYEIRMNGILVGEGTSEDVATIPGGTTRTLDTETAILNENLDSWWVSHLERDQVTNLTIDFSIVVDPSKTTGGALGDTVEPIEIPVEALDYEKRIETDIFGTKNGTDASTSGSAETGGSTDEETTGTATDDTSTEGDAPQTGNDATTTPTETPTDGGGLLGGGGSSTESADDTPVPTPEPTPTPTDTPTDSGGLLG